MNPQPFIKSCADTTIEDIPIVGGKNASLGEMFRELAGKSCFASLFTDRPISYRVDKGSTASSSQ